MYLKTENGEVVEVYMSLAHASGFEIDNTTEYCASRGTPDVRPIIGTSSWELFWMKLDGTGEIHIATYNTVEEANHALFSLKWTGSDEGWDAIEYKQGMESAS